MCADAELWHKGASAGAQSVEHFPVLVNALDEQEARWKQREELYYKCGLEMNWNEESQSMQSYL